MTYAVKQHIIIGERRSSAVNKSTFEVNQMTNEQTHILIEAIKIIAEKSKKNDELLKELDRLQEIKKPQ